MDEVTSVLALARMEGALVTPYLHSGVNTIVVPLADGKDEIEFKQGLTSKNVFEDQERGRQLLKRLGSMSLDQDLRFVSPEWIRKQALTKG